MSVPYARIWWPSSQGSSSPLELESADPRSFLTSADVWSGAESGKGGTQGIENPLIKLLVNLADDAMAHHL